MANIGSFLANNPDAWLFNAHLSVVTTTITYSTISVFALAFEIFTCSRRTGAKGFTIFIELERMTTKLIILNFEKKL